jgi:hypothetical protein
MLSEKQLARLVGVAFSAAGGLVKNGTLVIKGARDFDFQNMETSNKPIEVPVRALLFKEEIDTHLGVKVLSRKALVETKSVFELSVGDKLRFDGSDWDINDKIGGSAVHILVKLTRQANV